MVVEKLLYPHRLVFNSINLSLLEKSVNENLTVYFKSGSLKYNFNVLNKLSSLLKPKFKSEVFLSFNIRVYFYFFKWF